MSSTATRPRPSKNRHVSFSANGNGKPKSRHVSISANGDVHDSEIIVVPLSSITPSPLNNKLYRPVDPGDPEIIALARSIAQIGLQEAIVITIDNVILSGHRRYVACKLAGLTEVPCRRVNVRSTDQDFLPLLREYNRQRVKSIDEVIREEVITADPEESHRLLVEHRQRVSRVDADTITIEGHKHRARITAAKEPFLQAILDVLRDRRDYWPLTDRQIHYALLNDPPLIHTSKPDTYTNKKGKLCHNRYANCLECYKALCELVTRARLAGLIPFQAIDDPTRPIVTWQVYREPAGFIRGQLDDFLKGYYRDLMQSQPNQIEIVGEKNTIDNIIRPVAMEYCIPMTIGRGYSSLPPRKKMAERFQQGGKERLVILMLSDFDPEGEDIAHSFARSMRDDFDIKNILPIKVALTADQVEEMDLPLQMKAKEGSSRYAGFVKKHGDDVFELEAVPPAELQQILGQAIDRELDVKAYNAEIDAEKQDAARLEGIRRGIMASMGDILPPGESA